MKLDTLEITWAVSLVVAILVSVAELACKLWKLRRPPARKRGPICTK